MFYGHGANCTYTKSARERQLERDKRDQQRKEWSDAWHNNWVTVWRLKRDRLWTDGMIAKVLGRPRKRGKYKVFPVPLVREAERSPEFQAWLAPRLEKAKAKNRYFELLPLPDNKKT